MVTAVQQADVVELAAALLGVGTPEGSVAYRPDRPIFDLLESNDDFDEITIDISGRTSGLRETLAALDAVQLAIDAAAATVEYRIRYGDDDNEDAVRGRLRELAPDPVWELQIIELSSPGSFKARLKAFVSSPTARAKALAVAGLAAAVLTAIFPPAGAIAAAVVTFAVVVDAFFPAKPAKEALTDLLEAKQAEEREATGVNLPEWEQAVRASFETGIDKLIEYLKQRKLESLAREDALRAEVQELKVVVEKLQRASSLSELLQRMESFAASGSVRQDGDVFDPVFSARSAIARAHPHPLRRGTRRRSSGGRRRSFFRMGAAWPFSSGRSQSSRPGPP
jgi:hypothetical protein